MKIDSRCFLRSTVDCDFRLVYLLSNCARNVAVDQMKLCSASSTCGYIGKIRSDVTDKRWLGWYDCLALIDTLENDLFCTRVYLAIN